MQGVLLVFGILVLGLFVLGQVGDLSHEQWTSIFILTFMFAMTGIQASPAFTMWAFASESPKPFGVQQVFASSLVVGGIMFTLYRNLGTRRTFSGLNAYADLSTWKAFFVDPIDKSDTLIPGLMKLMQQPLLTSLLAICALAAMQSTAASYITTTSAILTRDLFNLSTEQDRPVFWGRLFALDSVIIRYWPIISSIEFVPPRQMNRYFLHNVWQFPATA